MLTNREKHDLILLDAEKFDWCAVEPNRAKEDWPRYDKNGGDLPSNNADCYVCQIVGIAKNRTIQCDSGQNCIVDWGGKELGCLKEGSIYEKFCSSSGKIRSHYALIIAETLRQAAAALPKDPVSLLGEWFSDVNGLYVPGRPEDLRLLILAMSPAPINGVDAMGWVKVACFITQAKKFVEKWAEPTECDVLNQRVHVTTKHLPGGFFFDPEARDILAILGDGTPDKTEPSELWTSIQLETIKVSLRLCVNAYESAAITGHIDSWEALKTIGTEIKGLLEELENE